VRVLDGRILGQAREPMVDAFVAVADEPAP
jgi:hypothetical protein